MDANLINRIVAYLKTVPVGKVIKDSFLGLGYFKMTGDLEDQG